VSRFSLSSAEIEGYEIKKPLINGTVAEILTCEKVEGSNHLSKLTVHDGTKKFQVICGAPNARAGIKVIHANIGVKVIAGVESHGMCLSAKELGISNDHDGIIEIKSGELGESVEKALPFVCDTIIEIDNKSITNRPDLWGHYGIARELSCIFNKKLKKPQTISFDAYENLPAVPIKIEADLCLSYGAFKVENVTRKQSPIEWQTRLHYLGMNPHGFLVDLSNLIMLETGQPNHGFGFASSVKFSVSQGLRAGEKFVTLKGQEISETVGKDFLFIKNDGVAVGLAGIMGGKNSEIAEDTKDCVFEFATFDAGHIRKTAAAISLRTDASARFEKSLDTNLNKFAAERLLYLLSKYDKGAKVTSKWSYVAKNPTKPIPLSVELDYVEKFCGVKFDWKTVVKKLTALEFAPTLNGNTLQVVSPTFRATKDVTMPADLIEEIVRTFGYDNIVPLPPRADIVPVNQPDKKELVNKLKDALSEIYGLTEVHTYIWGDSGDLRVVNSCVKGCDFIRGTIYHALLEVAEKNKNSVDNIRIFEIGQVAVKGVEQRHLSILVPGADYAHLAGIIRCVFFAKYKIGAEANGLHPKNSAKVFVAGKEVGVIGKVIGKEYAICEIDLGEVTCKDILGANKTFYTPSKYQKNKLDFTFEFKDRAEHFYCEIEDAFSKFSHPLFMSYRLKDVYEKSYTLEFTVGSYDKTLTSEDINDVWKKIIEFGAKNGLTLKQ
jgi:phenylalanyl-tRNA synthetase beta chain